MGINTETETEADTDLHIMHINADTELSELSDTHKYGINDGYEINGRVLVSVPIKYVEKQVSNTLPKLTPTHKHIEVAREENRADGDACDQVKCGTWKKIERKTVVSMQLDPPSERKPRRKKRQHNDQTIEKSESEEMGEKKWLRSLASNITSDMSMVVAADQPHRSQ